MSSLLNIFSKLLWGLSRVTRNQLREQDRHYECQPPKNMRLLTDWSVTSWNPDIKTPQETREVRFTRTRAQSLLANETSNEGTREGRSQGESRSFFPSHSLSVSLRVPLARDVSRYPLGYQSTYHSHGKLEIKVATSNGSSHFIWETWNNMGSLFGGMQIVRLLTVYSADSEMLNVYAQNF